ncbi:phosphoethanolamine transferase [Mariniflexile sp. AS56]|uniref:phosphoethanolamine transferase n=1 Tax=Mariniflexile sp. AS56 TaxID=3063957 RepID=UPI0026EECE93|nr:phosphoethanolamine transferase [Mariniflexile sp. AS56]MDO7172130.1 phosphoethanolamine transferase [Mariniflexile sp. AS56]
MKQFINKYKEIIIFNLVVNIIFALFVTLSSYYYIPLNNLKGKLMYFLHLCIVQGTFASIIYFLTLSRVIFKVVFSTLFIILSVVGYWTYSINISMSSALIDASVTTKPYIIKDLITVQFILFLVCSTIVLWGIHKYYKSIKPKQGIKLFFPLSCLLLVLYFLVNNERTRSLESKLPYSFFYALNEYFIKVDIPLKQTIKITDTKNFNKLNIVFVLGESLRADHLGLNGYNRETTPLLSKRQNLISFKTVYTNKTNTALSLPCILTDKSIYSNKNDSVRSVFSLFNALEIPTVWIGNQLLEPSYEQIVNTNKDVVIIDKFKSYWNIGKKHDLELLNEFNKLFKREINGLYTIHMIGSHWWYEDKYTDAFRKFKPVIDSKYIPSLSNEQIINSYDNTILYLDYFLNTLINKLETNNIPTVLVYLSDHGESLGENGKWLHSHTEALTNPGMMVWYSNSFKTVYPNKVEALNKNKERELSTDLLFHSLVDLIDNDNFNYNKELSIFYTKN